MKEKLAEKYAEGKSSSRVFRKAHMKDFLEGFNAAKKEIKDLYNHYNSKLEEATITKLGRRERTEHIIKLEAKVEILKTLLNEKPSTN